MRKPIRAGASHSRMSTVVLEHAKLRVPPLPRVNGVYLSNAQCAPGARALPPTTPHSFLLQARIFSCGPVRLDIRKSKHGALRDNTSGHQVKVNEERVKERYIASARLCFSSASGHFLAFGTSLCRLGKLKARCRPFRVMRSLEACKVFSSCLFTKEKCVSSWSLPACGSQVEAFNRLNL